MDYIGSHSQTDQALISPTDQNTNNNVKPSAELNKAAETDSFKSGPAESNLRLRQAARILANGAIRAALKQRTQTCSQPSNTLTRAIGLDSEGEHHHAFPHRTAIGQGGAE